MHLGCCCLKTGSRQHAVPPPNPLSGDPGIREEVFPRTVSTGLSWAGSCTDSSPVLEAESQSGIECPCSSEGRGHTLLKARVWEAKSTPSHISWSEVPAEGWVTCRTRSLATQRHWTIPLPDLLETSLSNS